MGATGRAIIPPKPSSVNRLGGRRNMTPLGRRARLGTFFQPPGRLALCAHLLARYGIPRVVEWHLHGREQTEMAGPCLLAFNHISHFDPMVLSGAIRRKVEWMTSAEFYACPLMAACWRAIGSIPIDRSRRDAAGTKQALRRLQDGAAVGVFPEAGIRTGSASVLEGAPLRSGATRLAALARAPIVPGVILGSDRLYRTARWFSFRRTPVWLAFGPPLSPGAEAEDLGRALRSLYRDLRARYDLQPEDLPATPQRRKGREPGISEI